MERYLDPVIVKGGMRVAVKTDKAPKPAGPYSQAIKAGEFIYVAGQGGVDPATGRFVEGGVEEQTRQTLKNIEAILRAAGSSLDDVVKVSVFLKDVRDFHAMNKVFAEFFKNPPPARTTVGVEFVVPEMLVEIDVVAYSPK
jgi:2-iminobutanoate/2-iminopropanoate deaminase